MAIHWWQSSPISSLWYPYTALVLTVHQRRGKATIDSNDQQLTPKYKILRRSSVVFNRSRFWGRSVWKYFCLQKIQIKIQIQMKIQMLFQTFGGAHTVAHRHASVTHWVCDCDTLLGRMWPPLTTCLYSSLCFYLNLHFFVQNLDVELMQDRLHSRMFFCVYFSCRISTLKNSTRPLSVSFLIRTSGKEWISQPSRLEFYQMCDRLTLWLRHIAARGHSSPLLASRRHLPIVTATPPKNPPNPPEANTSHPRDRQPFLNLVFPSRPCIKIWLL